MRAHLYAYLSSPEINHFTHLTPPYSPSCTLLPPTPPHAPYSPLLPSCILLPPTPLMHLTPPLLPLMHLTPPPTPPCSPSKKRVERYLIYYHTNTLCKQVDENHGINIVWGKWGCDSELYKYWNDNSR